MKKDELINEIENFKKRTKILKDLLLTSRNAVADIVKNHEEIAGLRSELNRTHARLEKYIMLFGNNPRMSDGVWSGTYPVYDNAFSADILQRVGPSISAVLQDHDYIVGKLEGLSEREFRDTINPPKKERSEKIIAKSVAEPKKQNFWLFSNPLWILIQLFRLIWKYKIISIAIVLIGLFAIDYSLTWKNASGFWNWLKGFLR